MAVTRTIKILDIKTLDVHTVTQMGSDAIPETALGSRWEPFRVPWDEGS